MCCCDRLLLLFTSVPQIEKDLLRTMPTNSCFSSITSVGVPRLRRVLRGLAWLYPDIGYCQGTGMVSTHTTETTLYRTRNMLIGYTNNISIVYHPFLLLLPLSLSLFSMMLSLFSLTYMSRSPQVVSCLLLFLEEEDVLWMMCALIEDLLPPSYFSSTLLGVQTDQRVLRQLIVQYLPALDRLLQEHDIGNGGKRNICGRDSVQNSTRGDKQQVTLFHLQPLILETDKNFDRVLW